MLLIVSVLLILCSCKNEVVATAEGMASYYSDSFQGQKTASGEKYDTSLYTAAHLELPFGQEVRVIRKDNGRSVRVRINDRGPFNRTRIIDLSKAAARELEMLDDGVVEVILEILAPE